MVLNLSFPKKEEFKAEITLNENNIILQLNDELNRNKIELESISKDLETHAKHNSELIKEKDALEVKIKSILDQATLETKNYIEIEKANLSFKNELQNSSNEINKLKQELKNLNESVNLKNKEISSLKKEINNQTPKFNTTTQLNNENSINDSNITMSQTQHQSELVSTISNCGSDFRTNHEKVTIHIYYKN